MSQSFLVFLFRNFWRLIFGLAGLILGLLWAIFGLTKVMVILLAGLLGFYFGKWMDEGRPGGGFLRFLRRYFE